MPYQNIDATLSVADVQAIKDAVAAIQAKLPFLVNLTVDERKGIFKAGPDSVSFLQNAKTAAQGNPSVFPASFNIPAFQKDVDLFAVMTELGSIIDSLASSIDDTRLAIGGEGMQAGIQVYDYIKAATKTTPGLKPLADQLGERFQKASKPKAPATPPA
jgi:hypothetical protein